MIILSQDMESFRATHDCEAEEWTVEWEDGQAVYTCYCGKEVTYEE